MDKRGIATTSLYTLSTREVTSPQSYTARILLSSEVSSRGCLTGLFWTSRIASLTPRTNASSVGATKKPLDSGSSSGTPSTFVETMTQPELRVRRARERDTKASRMVMLKDSVREQDR